MGELLSTNIHCVILSTDIPQNKKYILSLNPNEIVLPSIECTKNNIQDILKTIIEYIKNIIIVSDMEMIPQLISINEVLLPNKNAESLDIIYGFIVSFSPSLNNSFWIEFDHINTNKFTPLIIKVIQNLS